MKRVKKEEDEDFLYLYELTAFQGTQRSASA